MIESLKGRWFVVVLVLAAAIAWNIPNFSEKINAKNWFTKQEIVMGLDIQGGLHLVLGVDTETFLTEKIARESRNVKNLLGEEKISFASVDVNKENPSEFHIGLKAPTEAERIEKYLEDTFPATLQVVDTSSDKIVVRYYESAVREYKTSVVEQAIEVIRNRVDEYGVAEPSIAAQGDNRILVQLPGISEEQVAQAKDSINRTALLTFHGVSKEKTAEGLDQMIATAETENNFVLGKAKENGLPYSQYIKKLNEVMRDKLPKNTRVVFEKVDNAKSIEDGRRSYLVSTDDDLTGNQLEDARTGQDQYGRYEVNFRFTVQGRRKFADLTEKYAGGQIAIVLDDIVKSAPSVREKIDSDGARIELGAVMDAQSAYEEANFIALALRAGALPAALQQLEERTVGPTLGADSIAKGKTAGMVGGILVLFFMLMYYRWSLGIVANIALGMNVLLLLAILTSLGATLTLPGVAGIVLTVGMAVDANVIIFERIKEEIRKGASARAAIKDGFGHALSAIVDANITTAVVCIVLMYFGTGPVRGFAVTLLCGIVTSMFTAIFVSRVILDTFVDKLNFRRLSGVEA